MNKRINKLRNQTVETQPCISVERARLLTEFYKSPQAEHVSIPVKRALGFKHILENKEICFNDGELIVGERGPAPKATPTYPEITVHSMEDFDILDSREKTAYSVDEETRKVYREDIIPFWKGRSIRDRIFSNMSEEWKNAYEAGIFTEFMEQRAPGHTVVGKNIWKMGFLDFKKLIQKSIENLDFFTDLNALAKREQLKAMDIAADSIIAY
ncbi:MAG: formate C-acetyltransferase/glycerol dehydratase family glycyl radical enzyme, partial [Candidatus Aminicenantes bacterium]|nr:formate C-acetyltransferase/glycerol dehydratase family glycyl radical enzyme [Candidatus Aminicenantes bacterium]